MHDQKIFFESSILSFGNGRLHRHGSKEMELNGRWSRGCRAPQGQGKTSVEVAGSCLFWKRAVVFFQKIVFSGLLHRNPRKKIEAAWALEVRLKPAGTCRIATQYDFSKNLKISGEYPPTLVVTLWRVATRGHGPFTAAHPACEVDIAAQAQVRCPHACTVKGSLLHLRRDDGNPIYIWIYICGSICMYMNTWICTYIFSGPTFCGENWSSNLQELICKFYLASDRFFGIGQKLE